MKWKYLLSSGLSPGALTQDVVQVKGDVALLNSSLHLLGELGGKNSHESLGGKPVLCSLLVISLRHIVKHKMSSLVDVVDDLSEVGLEVSLGEVLQIGQSCWWNVSLPLKISFTIVNHFSDILVLFTESSE